MLEDAAPIAAITTTALRSRLDGCELLVIDVEDPAIQRYPCARLPAPAADDLAYIIYNLRHHRCAEGRGDHPPQTSPN